MTDNPYVEVRAGLWDRMSERERAVVRCLALEMSPQAVAEELGVTLERARYLLYVVGRKVRNDR